VVTNASRLISALADPTRRAVLESLKEGPRPVGEIAKRLPVTRPAVSQHLKVLKEAGLVTDRSVGTRRIYYIDPKGLGAMRAWLDQFWEAALDGFKLAAEAEAAKSAARKERDK
jgi:DNA-binding transcriptional ArsR family regulator